MTRVALRRGAGGEPPMQLWLTNPPTDWLIVLVARVWLAAVGHRKLTWQRRWGAILRPLAPREQKGARPTVAPLHKPHEPQARGSP